MVKGNKSRIESRPGEPFIRKKAALLSSHISQIKDDDAANEKNKKKKEEFL